MRTPELLRFLKRGIRQGTWPLLQRYVVAPSVLDLPPTRIACDGELGVHTFACESHAVMLHWALRSLINTCQVPFNLTIHDDGSCSAKTLALFSEKFVGAQVITREEASRRIIPLLKKYKLLYEWWPTTARSYHIKWLDPYLLGDSRYVIFLDSDVFFFDEPKELLKESSKTVWMRDRHYILELMPDESVSQFGGYPLPQLNSGLGRIERRRFNLDLVEAVLAYLKSPQGDMTVNAVITAQLPDFGLLPSSYDLVDQPGLDGKIARHYTTPFRFLLYEEGIPRVAKQLNLSLPRWLRERG